MGNDIHPPGYWMWALVAALLIIATSVSAQMPDPRQMSGVPRPDGALQTGTVTVRVIRGSFANPVVSQTVELLGGTSPLRATTDEAGRAEFSGLKAGGRLKASATVAGERLESQEFELPVSGGIRLMLVASASDPGQTSSAPAAASVPPQPGNVVIGDESRFVFEMGDDGISVFYVLQIVNTASTPVQPNAPLAFDLPFDARNAALLEGSSPQASVAGRRLTIAGPFQPGSTLVQLAYTMPFRGSEIVVEQKLPARLMHVAVVAQKVGNLELSSPQMPEQRTMPAQGNLYIAGRGGPVEAGDTLRFNFTGVPHHSTWPRDAAFAAAALLLGAGAWLSVRARGGGATTDLRRRELEARRDRLFGELTGLEVRHREHEIDPEEYASRRSALVASLEKVYIALDDDAVLGRAS